MFRGFLLAALTRVFGFWPAVLLSSIAFGFIHHQYPLDLRILVGGIGFVFCVEVRRTKALWAPWTSHTLLDVVVDLLFG